MSAGDARAVDPVKFEVIRNSLVEATEEMAVTLKRSAYSTNIKTRADFSCAIFDAEIRLVAQNFGQPSHLGSMVQLVRTALEGYGVERLAEGEAILTNHPFPRGVHLNDITVIEPIHVDGERFGFVANLAHHVDVGGGAPASIGAFREVYQEGVIIPPTRISRGDELDEGVFGLVLAQIRSKRETAGDLRAQLAANKAGIRRIGELVGRYGLDEIRFYIDELIAYAERRTRHEVSLLPQGTFEAEGQVDNDGFTDEPVRLRTRITIEGDRIRFDFTGCDAQRKAPVNSTFTQTYSACTYVLKALIDADVPANAGFYWVIDVVAPEGTVVHCTEPSPVVGGHETQIRLCDVMFSALAPALPERIPAASKGMQCHAGFGGIDPRTGEYYCFLETLGGGYGGRHGSDGPDAVQAHVQNTENAPVEETERQYPVRILRYELVEDSEGPGAWRGGLGLRRDYEFVGHEATFTVLADRDRAGAPGLFGGLPGRTATYVLNPDTDRERQLTSKVTLELEPGDVVSYRTCGGGGYGPPEERDRELVRRDLREGKISRARARAVYGLEDADG